ATMAALVLGLLIASAKNSYDTLRSELTHVSANVILLDRLMAHYGPETSEARHLLRGSVLRALDRMWPERRSQPGQLDPGAPSEDLYDRIEQLSPQSDAQRLQQPGKLRPDRRTPGSPGGRLAAVRCSEAPQLQPVTRLRRRERRGCTGVRCDKGPAHGRRVP